jgi:hypothetical protein
MSAVLYATNRPLSEGLRLRTIRTRSRSPGDHPWLGAFRRALTREDLATLTVGGYARDVGDFLRAIAMRCAFSRFSHMRENP